MKTQSFPGKPIDVGCFNFTSITANIREPNVIYFGNAKGQFTDAITYDGQDNPTYAVSLADLDNDGDLDIINGNSPGTNSVFFNQGDGRGWVLMELSKSKFSTYDIIAADINGNGRNDIIEANSDERNTYYINRPPRDN